MKKYLISIILLLLVIMGACSNNESNESEGTTEETSENRDTIIYESENGPVEVPANPKRVVVLSSFAGDVIKLGVNIVGADSWSMDNPNFAEGLKDAVEVLAEYLKE